MGALRRSFWKNHCGGRIHFLFMVRDSLYHLTVWARFFALAPKGWWKGWAHCKDPKLCKESGLFEKLPELTLVPKKWTFRCTDLVTAFAQLLKSALFQKKPRPGVFEKFVLLSEATLPVKPFHFVYATLPRDHESDFCFMKPQQWRSA